MFGRCRGKAWNFSTSSSPIRLRRMRCLRCPTTKSPRRLRHGCTPATWSTDGGTLQIGIGSLGDAIAQALIVRDRHGAEYRRC